MSSALWRSVLHSRLSHGSQSSAAVTGERREGVGESTTPGTGTGTAVRGTAVPLNLGTQVVQLC
eukprot:SAG31_NODE_4109_length_3573_cov_5.847726_1_plen_64_part_00